MGFVGLARPNHLRGYASNCLSIFRYDKTPPIFQCLRFVHSTVTIGSTSKPYPLSYISLPLLPPVATPPPPPPPPLASPAPPPCRAPRRLHRRPAPPRVAAAELRRMITISTFHIYRFNIPPILI